MMGRVFWKNMGRSLKRRIVQALIGAYVLVQGAVANADASPPGADRCKELAGLRLPDTKITLAQFVPASGFQPPTPTATPITDLPAFCRVAGVIEPRIGFEVWMPVKGWNKKLFGVGAGGLAGRLVYVTNSDSLPGMADVLRRGFAAAATDTGHVQGADRLDSSWLVGHPEQRVIFGYRAVHEMTVTAKEILRAYYGEKPRHSYFAGCSGGGRQGLMEAQRYPSDYDGIIAVAPGTPIELLLWLHRIGIATHKDAASRIAPDQLPMIRKAVLKRCDANDGVVDGLIEDPRRCDFSIGQLQCTASTESNCLTRAQVEALKSLYEPLVDATGQVLYPGLPPGHDFSGQLMPVLVAAPRPWPLTEGLLRNWVYEDPTWDGRITDMDAAIKLLHEKATPTLTVTPDLRNYQKAGGRVLLVHGWSDEGNPPQATIGYYENAIATAFGDARRADVARRAADFIRLFMVPGMNHCRGGPGPTDFDTVTALDRWVTEGVTPEKIIASQIDPASGVAARTRPLCAYPRAAVYSGSGSIDDAANFRCDVLPEQAGGRRAGSK